MREVDLATQCDGYSDVVKCTGGAYYAVAKHNRGACNGRTGPNIVRFMCPQCTAALLQISAFTKPFECTTCRTTFRALHEFIQVEHLVRL